MREVKITTTIKTATATTTTEIKISKIEFASKLCMNTTDKIENFFVHINDCIETIEKAIDKCESTVSTCLVSPILGIFETDLGLYDIADNAEYTFQIPELKTLPTGMTYLTQDELLNIRDTLRVIRKKMLSKMKLFKMEIDSGDEKFFKINHYCLADSVSKICCIDNRPDITMQEIVDEIPTGPKVILTPIVGKTRRDLLEVGNFKRRLDILPIEKMLKIILADMPIYLK